MDNKGYGIATPTDSPYRTPISNAIVVLQDRGLLYELKKRWWVDYGGGLCTDDVKVSSAMELNIENVGGVFVVLMGGVACGCLFGVLEFIWKSLKVARDERVSEIITCFNKFIYSDDSFILLLGIYWKTYLVRSCTYLYRWRIISTSVPSAEFSTEHNNSKQQSKQ